MLNAKALCTLLSDNTDHRLCKRWYLMTPNGTLLAYSQPVDIKDLRRHAALTALSWQTHHPRDFSEDNNDNDNTTEITSPSSPTTQDDSPRTLVIETDSHNTLIRRIEPQLVLVLEGAVPPRRKALGTKTWVEGRDGQLRRFRGAARPENLGVDEDLAASISTLSTASTRGNGSGLSGVVAMQRGKLDAMADALIDGFARSGFRMPDEANQTSYF